MKVSTLFGSQDLQPSVLKSSTRHCLKDDGILRPKSSAMRPFQAMNIEPDEP